MNHQLDLRYAIVQDKCELPDCHDVALPVLCSLRGSYDNATAGATGGGS